MPQNSFRPNSLSTYVAAIKLISKITRLKAGINHGGSVKVRLER